MLSNRSSHSKRIEIGHFLCNRYVTQRTRLTVRPKRSPSRTARALERPALRLLCCRGPTAPATRATRLQDRPTRTSTVFRTILRAARAERRCRRTSVSVRSRNILYPFSLSFLLIENWNVWVCYLRKRRRLQRGHCAHSVEREQPDAGREWRRQHVLHVQFRLREQYSAREAVLYVRRVHRSMDGCHRHLRR